MANYKAALFTLILAAGCSLTLAYCPQDLYPDYCPCVCASVYRGFEKAMLENENNRLRLFMEFFPSNFAPPVYGSIIYDIHVPCQTEPNSGSGSGDGTLLESTETEPCDEHFETVLKHWSSSLLLANINPLILNSFQLHILDVIFNSVGTLELTLEDEKNDYALFKPYQVTARIRMVIDNYTLWAFSENITDAILEDLTSWLKIYAVKQTSIDEWHDIHLENKGYSSKKAIFVKVPVFLACIDILFLLLLAISFKEFSQKIYETLKSNKENTTQDGRPQDSIETGTAETDSSQISIETGTAETDSSQISTEPGTAETDSSQNSKKNQKTESDPSYYFFWASGLVAFILNLFILAFDIQQMFNLDFELQLGGCKACYHIRHGFDQHKHIALMSKLFSIFRFTTYLVVIIFIDLPIAIYNIKKERVNFPNPKVLQCIINKVFCCKSGCAAAQIFALWNIYAFLHLVSISALPLLLWVFILPIRTFTITALIASTIFCVTAISAFLIEYMENIETYRQKMCSCILRPLIVVLLLVTVILTALIYNELITTGLETNTIAGFLVSFLPSGALTAIGWFITSKHNYEHKPNTNNKHQKNEDSASKPNTEYEPQTTKDEYQPLK